MNNSRPTGPAGQRATMRSMSPLTRRLAAGTVAVLSGLIVVIVVLRGGVAPAGAAPSSSGALLASPPASVTATGLPSASQDPQAGFARIEDQVERLRGLPAPNIGPPQLISRAQLEQELKASFAADYPVARQRADNLTLHALGLLKPGQDVAKLQLQLLTGQIIGFYDDKKKRMAIVSSAGADPRARITYAHEFTHALQDHAFGLSSLDLQAVGEDDRSLARLSLVEGDATYTMLQWALAHMSPDELRGVTQSPVPDMSGIPGWMVQQLLFPYDDGFRFVMALYARAGGFAGVDAAFRDRLPASTEQIMDPQKYFANERPMPVTAVDPVAALGAGWQQVESTTEGAAMVRIGLQGLGVGAGAAATAAAGWGGDRLVVASGPSGAFALAWRLEWDTPTDADQFAAAYASIRGSLPFPAVLVRRSATDLLVVHASSQAVLDAVVGASR